MPNADISAQLCNLTFNTHDALAVFSVRQEKLAYFRSGSWRTKQIALYFRAAQSSKLFQLLRCFYALGDDPDLEASSQIDNRANDGARSFFGRKIGNEAAVYLDLAEGETQQIAERRVTRAKIIHRKLHTELMQAFQRGEIGGRIL